MQSSSRAPKAEHDEGTRCSMACVRMRNTSSAVEPQPVHSGGDTQMRGEKRLAASSESQELLPPPEQRRQKVLRRAPSDVSRQEVEALYYLPADEAARVLRLTPASLKALCKQMGVDRWPYKRVQLMYKLLLDVDKNRSNMHDMKLLHELTLELGVSLRSQLWSNMYSNPPGGARRLSVHAAQLAARVIDWVHNPSRYPPLPPRAPPGPPPLPELEQPLPAAAAAAAAVETPSFLSQLHREGSEKREAARGSQRERQPPAQLAPAAGACKQRGSGNPPPLQELMGRYLAAMQRAGTPQAAADEVGHTGQPPATQVDKPAVGGPQYLNYVAAALPGDRGVGHPPPFMAELQATQAAQVLAGLQMPEALQQMLGAYAAQQKGGQLSAPPPLCPNMGEARRTQQKVSSGGAGTMLGAGAGSLDASAPVKGRMSASPRGTASRRELKPQGAGRQRKLSNTAGGDLLTSGEALSNLVTDLKDYLAARGLRYTLPPAGEAEEDNEARTGAGGSLRDTLLRGLDDCLCMCRNLMIVRAREAAQKRADMAAPAGLAPLDELLASALAKIQQQQQQQQRQGGMPLWSGNVASGLGGTQLPPGPPLQGGTAGSQAPALEAAPPPASLPFPCANEMQQLMQQWLYPQSNSTQ